MSTETTTAAETTSRLSNPMALIPEFADVAKALFVVTGNGSVPKATISLLQLRAGQIVGNTYLTIMHSRTLRQLGESEERITAVSSWFDAPYFTPAERAALALVEAVLTANPQNERVSDALYAQAAEHYDETGLATLCAAIGQVLFFVPFAVIGRPLPGRSPSEQWR
jgi:alkylhydroperoxidase family enzyme